MRAPARRGAVVTRESRIYHALLMREGLTEEAEAFALECVAAEHDHAAFDAAYYAALGRMGPRSADLSIEGGSARSQQVEAEHWHEVQAVWAARGTTEAARRKGVNL